MTIPNLAGVIKKDDVFKKGGADYAPWARIANYLHEHANGWEFNLQPAPQGGHVWTAPDGTGYLVGYFTGPDDEATPDFPYAITDNRNNPIQAERISARALTDAHRRGFCAAAAFTFGLGHELWAKAEVAAASDEVEQKPAETTSKPKPSPKMAPKAATAPAPEQPSDPPASKEDIATVLSWMKEMPADKRDAVIDAYRSEFGLDKTARISTHIASAAHVAFLQRALGEQ
jgi:hypothetical protein